MTQFADDLYERFAPFHPDDDANDNALQDYTGALAAMFEQVETYAREREDIPGWTGLVAPSFAPEDQALRWIAQMAGVRLTMGLSTAAMQSQLSDAIGRRRGTFGYLSEVAQPYLTGTKFVAISERTPDAYAFTVMTRTGETPDPAAVLAAIRDAKPAGLVMTYTVGDGITWDESTNTWDAATITWDESLSVVP